MRMSLIFMRSATDDDLRFRTRKQVNPTLQLALQLATEWITVVDRSLASD